MGPKNVPKMGQNGGRAVSESTYRPPSSYMPPSPDRPATNRVLFDDPIEDSGPWVSKQDGICTFLLTLSRKVPREGQNLTTLSKIMRLGDQISTTLSMTVAIGMQNLTTLSMIVVSGMQKLTTLSRNVAIGI